MIQHVSTLLSLGLLTRKACGIIDVLSYSAFIEEQLEGDPWELQDIDLKQGAVHCLLGMYDLESTTNTFH